MIDLYELAGADPDIRFSPHSWRIRMAIAHKGLRPRLLPWHFGEKRLPGGNTQVPVLVDDGEVIADSTDIAFHLETNTTTGPACSAAKPAKRMPASSSHGPTRFCCRPYVP